MRLLLVGGGTGGHLFPAVALAERVMKEQPQSELLFVGTRNGLEFRLLPKLGLPLETVDMAGVVGKGFKDKLRMLPRLLKSLVQARRIINRFRPDLVVGFGGYVCVPVLAAAKISGVPYIIHEQNALPGLSNKLAAKAAELVCVSYPETQQSFGSATVVVTGNPLRQGLGKVPAEIPGKGILLVFGGSRGATAINDTMVSCLQELRIWENPPEILHQTGEEDLERIRAGYAAAGYGRARVVSFIDDMAAAYAQARLVVCRAGATTLAELTLCGRPAILIPYPFAAADHQTANARVLEQAGAAVVLPQHSLSPLQLATEIRILFEDDQQLQAMAERGRLIAVPDAAQSLLSQCLTLVQAG